MEKCIVSDGITSKEVSLDEFLYKSHCVPNETEYPFVMIYDRRFYFNSFLFL